MEKEKPRPRNKADLLTAANENYGKIMEFIGSMSEAELNTPFDFSKDASKKEAHRNRNQSTSLEEAKKNLAETHGEVLALIEKYSNEELFNKKHFFWTGGTDIGSYFVSSTSSHYDWAIKKLKAHRKNLSN